MVTTAHVEASVLRSNLRRAWTNPLRATAFWIVFALSSGASAQDDEDDQFVLPELEESDCGPALEVRHVQMSDILGGAPENAPWLALRGTDDAVPFKVDIRRPDVSRTLDAAMSSSALDHQSWEPLCIAIDVGGVRYIRLLQRPTVRLESLVEATVELEDTGTLLVRLESRFGGADVSNWFDLTGMSLEADEHTLRLMSSGVKYTVDLSTPSDPSGEYHRLIARAARFLTSVPLIVHEGVPFESVVDLESLGLDDGLLRLSVDGTVIRQASQKLQVGHSEVLPDKTEVSFVPFAAVQVFDTPLVDTARVRLAEHRTELRIESPTQTIAEVRVRIGDRDDRLLFLGAPGATEVSRVDERAPWAGTAATASVDRIVGLVDARETPLWDANDVCLRSGWYAFATGGDQTDICIAPDETLVLVTCERRDVPAVVWTGTAADGVCGSETPPLPTDRGLLSTKSLVAATSRLGLQCHGSDPLLVSGDRRALLARFARQCLSDFAPTLAWSDEPEETE